MPKPAMVLSGFYICVQRIAVETTVRKMAMDDRPDRAKIVTWTLNAQALMSAGGAVVETGSCCDGPNNQF
jgi:hypothetical protein